MEPSTPQSGDDLDVPLHKIELAHRRAMIVTGSIGASLVVYAVVVEVLRRSLPPAAPLLSYEMLRLTMFAIAGVTVFTASVLKGLLLRNAPGSGDLRITRLLTASIISAAFAEVPVIFGLVLFIVGRQTSDFYILAVISLYVLVRNLPNKSQWESYVRHGGAQR